MATATFEWFSKAFANEQGGEAGADAFHWDWLTDTIKIALATNAYAPNLDTHEMYADLTNEVANGNGYTTGGATLGSKTLGQPWSAAAQPFTIRQYIGGSAPSLANQLKISDVFITLRGGDAVKPWSHVKAGFGHHAYQGQNGGTMGTAALYANSANPGAAVPTNTTAALGSGLGGNFQETLTLASPNDGIISSYQNPAGGVTQTPRTFYCTGVSISGIVTVVLPATICSKLWSIAFGHTAVSLATAEAATTKAPRRVGLGCSSIAASAAVGTFVAGPSVKFDTPIPVAPGEFFQVVNKNATAAPASGAVLWNITVDGYFE